MLWHLIISYSISEIKPQISFRHFINDMFEYANEFCIYFQEYKLLPKILDTFFSFLLFEDFFLHVTEITLMYIFSAENFIPLSIIVVCKTY